MKKFFSILALSALAIAKTNVPPCQIIFSDDFENNNLDKWHKVNTNNLTVEANSGVSKSVALNVSVDNNESYIYQYNLMNADEAYLDFYFNPVGITFPITNTWIPGRSIRIADIKGGSDWHALVALRVFEPTNNVYYAYLSWRAETGNTVYDYSSGAFLLTNAWQKITIGYQVDNFVAAWINNQLKREIVNVAHEQNSGSIIEIGKASRNTSIIPSGNFHFDNIKLLVPKVLDIYVDAQNGNDTNSGDNISTPLKTIQRASELVSPGATVHILPGVYRETIEPTISGTASEPIAFKGEDPTNNVRICGSEPASSFSWSQLSANTIGLPPSVEPTNIWYANLSNWAVAPRFVVDIDQFGNYNRLPCAREPDYFVSNDWKRHEFWWAADGGSAIPTSTVDNADFYTRSTLQLLDRTNDTEPQGIESGNLTTLGNLVGATLVVLDTVQGHYVFRRTITNHDVSAGIVTVDKICEHDSGSGNPGLGVYSKYYVEGKPYLLDSPGEWWFDPVTSNIYLYPLTPGNPANQNIEISYRSIGLKINNLSYNIFDNLTFELYNGSAIYSANDSTQKSYSNVLNDVIIKYSGYGIYLAQGVTSNSSPENVTDGFTLQNSKVHHIDNFGFLMNYWWENSPNADTFSRPGIINTSIVSNEFYELAFYSDYDDPVGLSFQFPSQIRMENNYFHNTAHNGVQFSRSVIRSDKSYDLNPDDILTGNILVKNNIFEKCCQLTTDNGGLKFWGNPPDHHVFKNVLVCNNISRYNYGWTYVAEKRGRWTLGNAKGTGGCGYYIDMCSGIHFFRNIAYKNGYENFRFAGVWRDGIVVLCNNIAANSIYGCNLGWIYDDTHGCVDLEVYNNILINNEGRGFYLADADGIYSNMFFDNNLYSSNGWGGYPPFWKAGDMAVYRGTAQNEYYPTVDDIFSGRGWEYNGIDADPCFNNYDFTNRNIFIQNFPDFHLTLLSSNAIDCGTASLPVSLTNLLTVFNVDNGKIGAYFDMGAYEFIPEPSCFLIFSFYLLILFFDKNK